MARRFSDGMIGQRTTAPFGVHSVSDQFERKRAGAWPEAGADLRRRALTRPADWLTLPSVSSTEQKIVGLVGVENDTLNYLAFNIGMARPVITSTYTSSTTTDGTGFGHGPSVPLSAGGLFVIAVQNTGAVSAPTVSMTVTTPSGTLTPTLQQTLLYNSNLNRITIFTLVTDQTITAYNVSSPTTSTGWLTHVSSVSNADTTTNSGIVQIKTATGTSAVAAVTLDSAPTALVLAVRGTGDNLTTNPGAGYTETADGGQSNPSQQLQTFYASPGTATPTSTQPGSISSPWGIIAIEIVGLSYATNPQYTVDWGDGATETVSGGVTAEHQYSFAGLSSGTTTSEGWRQAVVTVSPVGSGRIDRVTLTSANSANQSTSSYRWKDVVISAPYWASGGSPVSRSAHFIRIISSALSSGLNLFTGCMSARNIEFASSVELVGSASNMFAGCFSLRNVSFPAFGAVTNTSTMFQNCRSLETAPFFKTSSVTNASSMFQNCVSLQYVPQYDFSAATTLASAFFGCASLRNVPAFPTSSVLTNVDSMFNGCASLENAPFLNTGSVTNMSSMFNGCSSLLTVPLYNTANAGTVASMFNNCSSLETIPAFDFSKVGTFSTMFSGCDSLRVIPDINMPLATGSFINFALNISNLEYIGMTWGAVAQTSQAVNSASLRYIKPLNFSNFTGSASPFSTCSSLTTYLPTGMRFSISCANFALDAVALEALFDCLGIASGAAQTLTITGNRGAPTPISLSGTTTSGSTTVTMASTTGLATGMEISGTGISSAAAVTFQDAGDTVTRIAHGLANDTRVSFASITGTTGISTYTYYYVVNATADTFQVANTVGGAPRTLTTDGSGTILYGTTIVAIVPNTSITLSTPASASGTITTASATLKRSMARLKGWAVTG